MWLDEPVVLPDQLVGTVVLVCDRGAPSGDGINVSVVVNRSIDRVTIVLVRDQQGCSETVDLSKWICQKNHPLDTTPYHV